MHGGGKGGSKAGDRLSTNQAGRGCATVGKQVAHLVRGSPDRRYNELCGNHVDARWADENPERFSGVDQGGEEMRWGVVLLRMG